MRTYIVPPGQLTLDLGVAGENEAQAIRFNVSCWQASFGAGSVSLLVCRPGEKEPYPVTLTVEDGVASWVVSSLDTAIAGIGQAELMYLVGNAVVKSRIYQTYVAPSLDGSNPSDPTVDPWAQYVATVTKAAGEAQEAAQKAQDALTHGPTIKDGTWWLWDATEGIYKDTGDSASGLPGPEGPPGKDGAPGPEGPPGKDAVLPDAATFERVIVQRKDTPGSGVTLFSQVSDDASTIYGVAIIGLLGPTIAQIAIYPQFDSARNVLSVLVNDVGAGMPTTISYGNPPSEFADFDLVHKRYVNNAIDTQIGSINTILDNINGEVV